jgi:uncharacterized protein involved in outer membrane biogenesis
LIRSLIPQFVKLAAIIAAALAMLAVLAGGALALVDTGAANGLVRTIFHGVTHRALAFRRLDFHLLQADPTIVVEGLQIGSPPEITRDPLVHIDHGVFHVRLLPMLIGHVTLTGVELTGVDLRMIRLGHARNNYSFGGAGLSAALHAVTRMTISRAQVAYIDPQRQLTLKAQVNYDSRQGARPMLLQGGGVDHGEPYLVQAKGAPLTGRRPAMPYAFDASLADGAVKVALSGSTQKPFDFREFDLALNGSGPNLADLGYLFGVGVPTTPAFALSAQATHHNHILSFQQIKGTMGASTVAGDFTSDHSHPRRVLTAHVRAGLLRAEDIAVFFAPRPPHATTRSQPGAAPAKSADAGQKPFDVDGFRRLDALFDLTADKVTGYPVPLSAVHLHLQLKDGVLEIRPFAAMLSPGRIDVSLKLKADQDALATQVDATVRDVQMDRMAVARAVGGSFDGAAHLSGEGRSQKQLLANLQGGAAFRLRNGTVKRSQADALGGDTIAAAWAAFADKSAEVALTCARGRFAVRGGVLTPSDLVIATKQGDAAGQGSIDLAARGIDLTQSAMPSGGRRPALSAPIHLTGDLQHPKVSVDLAHAAKQSPLKVIGAVLAAPFKGAPPPTPPAACPAPF